jgi:hypothetical protein
MCVWQSGDMPRSTKLDDSGAAQERQWKLRITQLRSRTSLRREPVDHLGSKQRQLRERAQRR